MSDLIITNHAADRFHERMGLPKRVVTRNAARALELGITHADTSGQLRKYLDKLYLAQESANNIRVYGNTVYIFYFDTLITLFALPRNLQKQAAKTQQRKRRQQT